MMLHDEKGNIYKVHFHHTHFGPDEGLRPEPGRKIRGKIVKRPNGSTFEIHFQTECALHFGPCALHDRLDTMPPCGTPSFVGLSMVSVLDQFGPLDGRRRALTRAMHEANLSRETRKALWDEYFKKTPKLLPKNVRLVKPKTLGAVADNNAQA